MGTWYLDLHHIGMHSILSQDNSKNKLEDKLNKYYTLIPPKSVEPKDGIHFVLDSLMKQVY